MYVTELQASKNVPIKNIEMSPNVSVDHSPLNSIFSYWFAFLSDQRGFLSGQNCPLAWQMTCLQTKIICRLVVVHIFLDLKFCKPIWSLFYNKKVMEFSQIWRFHLRKKLNQNIPKAWEDLPSCLISLRRWNCGVSIISTHSGWTSMCPWMLSLNTCQHTKIQQ